MEFTLSTTLIKHGHLNLIMNKLLKNKAWLLLFLLIILALIPLSDLTLPGLFDAHDSQDHVARIANFYQNLVEGNIIPRWAANLNWGYGHPILIFLYPLPSYTASLLHFIGFSFVNSTKIVFGLGFVLSGITMFLWTKEMWDEKSGFISGLVYMLAPYRFVDLYVRGAIGENFFFIWPPLVCYFLLKLSKNVKWQYLIGGALAFAFMILSHNALLLMFMLFIILYAVILLLPMIKNKNFLVFLISFIVSALLGFGLSAFFWLPAFLEGKYTLRDIVTGGEIFNRFETFQRLVYSSWRYGGTGIFSVQLGVVQWIIILIMPFIIYQFRQERKKIPDAGFLWLFIISFAIFWLSVFLILPISAPIYQYLTIFQKFQFPWRWLSLAILPPAIFAGLIIFILPEKIKQIVFCVLIVGLFWFNKNYWSAKGFIQIPDSFYNNIYQGTTDTGESAPIWSVRFMLKKPDKALSIIEGEGEIITVARKSIEHVYKIDVQTEKARLLENTLYFPGWRVYIDNNKTDIQFQDPQYRGLMTFWVGKGEHLISVKFGETKLRLIADIISLGSLIIIFSLPWLLRKWKI